MRFSTATLFAAFAAFALASENAFSVPDASSVITAGKAFQVTWAPTTKGDVILTLRKGPSDNLDTIGVLDSKLLAFPSAIHPQLTYIPQPSRTLVTTSGPPRSLSLPATTTRS